MEISCSLVRAICYLHWETAGFLLVILFKLVFLNEPIIFAFFYVPFPYFNGPHTSTETHEVYRTNFCFFLLNIHYNNRPCLLLVFCKSFTCDLNCISIFSSFCSVQVDGSAISSARGSRRRNMMASLECPITVSNYCFFFF